MYQNYEKFLDNFAVIQTKAWLRIIAFIFGLSIFILAYVNVKRNSKDFRKIPGLKLRFWQIFGHPHLLFHKSPLKKAMHSSHVYDFQTICSLTRIQEKKSLALFWIGTLPLFLLFKQDAVKAILSSPTHLRKGFVYTFLMPWLGTGLLTSHGEKWKQRRKLLTPTFHFNILKTFQDGINRQAKILVNILKEITNKPWIDVAPIFTRCTLDIIGETTLGVQINSQTDSTSEYVQAVLGMSEIIFTRFMYPWLWPDRLFALFPTGRKFWRYNKLARDFTMKAITDRKKEVIKMGYTKKEAENDDVYKGHKRRALLDFLLEEHLTNQNFSEDDIREEVDTFTFEGHDTTSMGLTWALYLIGLYPEVQRKVHSELENIFRDDLERDVTMDDVKDMKYLECVLKESQRLYPSVPIYIRQLDEDLEYEGVKIPKGSNCAVVTYMLHRDPDVFQNPEVFDPDRFLLENSDGRDPFAYVPFSAGPRNCVGQKFAMMEEKIVLSTILRNYTVRSLDPRDKVQVMGDLILRPSEQVRIQFKPR